jgi:hypothetical protein
MALLTDGSPMNICEHDLIASQAPPPSRRRFRFTIGLLVKLIVLCAVLAASFREPASLLITVIGTCLALAIILRLKKDERGVNGSAVPGWLACACIVTVVFTFYWFASPIRSAIWPGILALAIPESPTRRIVGALRRAIRRLIYSGYEPPPADRSCGHMAWREVDEPSANAGMTGK